MPRDRSILSLHFLIITHKPPHPISRFPADSQGLLKTASLAELGLFALRSEYSASRLTPIEQYCG